jgi:hypothetical protein
MPDVDVLLSQIARANGFAAAMIDTAMRKRFELMVAEFQRELDAIEEHPGSQRDSDKTEAGDCVALRFAHGWLTMHPSGGYLTFTQAGADLFA